MESQSFQFQGVTIEDPSLDETGREEVGPDYYYTTVQIPTMLYARIVQGKVTQLTIVPKEGDAGYFGPPSQVDDGPPLDIETFWNELMPPIFDDETVKIPVLWEG